MVLVKCWLVVLLLKQDLTLFKVVEAQATPDPDFSTVKSPNPESQAAFALAEELGRQVGADVLVATDPDADRVGVEVLQKDGSYLNLSGNQIGAIMAKYILEAHKKRWNSS